MNNDVMQCDDRRLQRLLVASDHDVEVDPWMEHVDQCPECQLRLRELAADDQDWRTTVAVLAFGDHDEPSFDRDHAVQLSWNEAMVKQLLQPPSHPEMLGRLGRYEIERMIGSGGMGIVFKAFDTELNRVVAIKLLAPYLAARGSARKRFAREARAAAGVRDDHVVPIFNVESEKEPPFLVMQYVAGGSLQEKLGRDGSLEVPEVLRIGLQTAKGLAAAHAQGLIHRDVKPSNILLDEGVERALLTDFGLARAEDDACLTRSGFHPGTPHFMSPEQVRGEAIDGRSDLFGLGCVLYSLCTGHSPFRADTSYAVMRRITDEEPRSIRETNPEVPEWLEQVVMKLLSKSRDARFASTEQVAELLEGCLAHVQEPTTTTLPAPVVELARTFGDHRKADVTKSRGDFRLPPIGKLIAMAALGFSLIFAGALIVLELNKGTLTIECDAGDVPIRIMRGDKVAKRLVVTESSESVRIASGQYTIEIDGPHDGLKVDSGIVVVTRGDVSVVTIRATKGLDSGESAASTAKVNPLPRKDTRLSYSISIENGIAEIAASRELPYPVIAGAIESLAEAGFRRIKFADAEEFAPKSQMVSVRVTGGAAQLRVSSNTEPGIVQAVIAALQEAGFEDFSLRAMDHEENIARGRSVFTIRILNDTAEIDATSEVGHELLAKTIDRLADSGIKKIKIAAREPASGAGKQEEEVPQVLKTQSATDTALRPTDSRAHTTSRRINESTAWNLRHVFHPAHEQGIGAVTFSPDERIVASAAADKTVKLWDVATGDLLSTIHRPVNCIGLSFSPDGTLLAIAGGNHGKDPTGELVILELGENGNEFILENPELSKYTCAVSFSPDGRWLASGGTDTQVKVWDVKTKSLSRTLSGHNELVRQVAFTSDSRTLASAGFDKTIRLWNVSDGTLVATLDGHQKEVRSVAFSPDDKLLVSVSDDKTARIWDVASHQQIGIMDGHQSQVFSLAFLPDGKHVVTGSKGKMGVLIWDIKTQNWGSPSLFPRQGREVTSIAVSQTGNMLAIAGGWNSFQVWQRNISVQQERGSKGYGVEKGLQRFDRDHESHASNRQATQDRNASPMQSVGTNASPTKNPREWTINQSFHSDSIKVGIGQQSEIGVIAWLESGKHFTFDAERATITLEGDVELGENPLLFVSGEPTDPRRFLLHEKLNRNEVQVILNDQLLKEDVGYKVEYERGIVTIIDEAIEAMDAKYYISTDSRSLGNYVDNGVITKLLQSEPDAIDSQDGVEPALEKANGGKRDRSAPEPKAGDSIILSLTGDVATEYARHTGTIRNNENAKNLTVETSATIAQHLNDGRYRIEHHSSPQVIDNFSRITLLRATVDPTAIVRETTPQGAVTNDSPTAVSKSVAAKVSHSFRLTLSDLDKVTLKTFSASTPMENANSPAPAKTSGAKKPAVTKKGDSRYCLDWESATTVRLRREFADTLDLDDKAIIAVDSLLTEIWTEYIDDERDRTKYSQTADGHLLAEIGDLSNDRNGLANEFFSKLGKIVPLPQRDRIWSAIKARSGRAFDEIWENQSDAYPALLGWSKENSPIRIEIHQTASGFHWYVRPGSHGVTGSGKTLPPELQHYLQFGREAMAETSRTNSTD